MHKYNQQEGRKRKIWATGCRELLDRVDTVTKHRHRAGWCTMTSPSSWVDYYCLILIHFRVWIWSYIRVGKWSHFRVWKWSLYLQRLGQLGVAQACFCLPVHDVLVRCLVRDGRRSWHSLEPMSFSSTSQCHICTVNDIWGHKMSDVLWIMYDSVWLYGMIRHAAWWPVIVFWSILCIFVSWWSW